MGLRPGLRISWRFDRTPLFLRSLKHGMNVFLRSQRFSALPSLRRSSEPRSPESQVALVLRRETSPPRSPKLPPFFFRTHPSTSLFFVSAGLMFPILLCGGSWAFFFSGVISFFFHCGEPILSPRSVLKQYNSLGVRTFFGRKVGFFFRVCAVTMLEADMNLRSPKALRSRWTLLFFLCANTKNGFLAMRARRASLLSLPEVDSSERTEGQLSCPDSGDLRSFF